MISGWAFNTLVSWCIMNIDPRREDSHRRDRKEGDNEDYALRKIHWLLALSVLRIIERQDHRLILIASMQGYVLKQFADCAYQTKISLRELLSFTSPAYRIHRRIFLPPFYPL